MLLNILIAGCVLTKSIVSSDVALDISSGNTFENSESNTIDSKVILQRLQKLENGERRCWNRLDEIESELNRVNNKNRELELKVGATTKTVERVTSENKDLRTVNEELRNKIRDLERVMSSINTRSLQADRANRASSQTQPLIAFYVRAVAMLAHLGPGQTFIFDHVITNYGNAYDRRSGHFTAPVDGVYVFSTTVMTASKNNSYAGFAVNGHVVSTILLRDLIGDNSSQQSILFLHKDDYVSLQNIIYDSSYEGGDQTVFSGYLLNTISSSSAIAVG